MHTSGPCTAPSLPHRYTLRLCLILRYLAHLHMASLSTSYSCGCVRGGSWGERYKGLVWRTYNLQTEAVSDVLPQLSRVLERLNWFPYPGAPLVPAELWRTTITRRRKRAMERKKFGRTLKEWRSEIEREVNWVDKELGGRRKEKGRLKRAW